MNKRNKKQRRHLKVRKKVSGSLDKPRLVVFRSNKNTYAQIIDDQEAKTIVSSNSAKISTGSKSENQSKKIMSAHETGQKLAQLAVKKKITKVVFDRGGYKYHGRIKALAEGARKGGLKF